MGKDTASLKLSQINTFKKGINYEAYKFLGSRRAFKDGEYGVAFCVWAPNANEVRVVGDFNKWNGCKHKMLKVARSGLWWKFIPKLTEGELYKYEIVTKNNDKVMKSDPYAFYSEKRPKTASIVKSIEGYSWNDKCWMDKRNSTNIYKEPINIYEIHLGSWKRKKNGDFLSYREIANELVEYILDMGYTHVEILPIQEHPHDASWGYQATGYYSVTSRYGEPEDFMYLVDKLHQNNIGVILDWAPGHFCKDEHGLYKFDGTHIYDYEDEIKRENYDWGTSNFDLGRPQVKSFLISNAMFWFKKYHIDGIRVDAVASMLYLNYSKEHLDIKNKKGGVENLEAIEFFKDLNKAIFNELVNPLVIAEDSTAWPMVTKPTYDGGLGFNFKWNMGWMNDILKYMEILPMERRNFHKLITFSIMYAFSENFMLPFSHDEVVHGKKSMLDKMPGEYEEKFANLRSLYGFMMAHPGKKLLFMGGEFGQFIEWRYNKELDWLLLDYPMHHSMKTYVKELNNFYKENSELYLLDYQMDGFEWIDADNNDQSIIVFMRKGNAVDKFIIIVCNFTGIEYKDFKIGVPYKGTYKEVFNSDCKRFGGTNFINNEKMKSKKERWHNQSHIINLKIPAFSTIYIKPLIIEKEELEDGKKGNDSDALSRGSGEQVETFNKE